MTQRWFDKCRRHAVTSTAVLTAIATSVAFISPVAQGASADATTTTAVTTTSVPTTTTTAVPGSNCSATESGFTLDRTGWTATSNAPSSSADAPANALDGNYSSRFSTNEDQVPGLYFAVNLSSAESFNELKMSMPESPNDYARGFDVYVSNDGSSWAKVASCTGSGTPEIVSFSPQSAKYVKVLLNTSADMWWSIDEFNLYNPTTQPTTTTTLPTTTTTAVPGSNCSATESGFTLDRTGWTATSNAPSSSADAPANALDGNYSSRFSTNEDQAPGLYFAVNLGSAENFNELKMSMPGSPNDYARGFDVYVSSDGSSWAKVASCTGTGTPEVVSFSPQSAKYVKILLNTAANIWWSIDEFNLYNPTTQPTTTTTLPTTTTTAVPGSNCSATESGFTLDRTGWTATSNAPSSSADAPANALDGNYSSRFSTNEDQAPGLYFAVNLGSAENFNELKMSMPGSPNDYARGFDVYVSSDGSSWAKVASCTGTGTPEVVSFSPQSAKYVKILLNTAANIWWSIDEFNLY